MAFSLSTVLTSARDQHPAFHRSRAPDAVVARWLSDYVNTLIQRATARDAAYMRQSASVVLAISSANTVGVAGAGTSGGLPGTVSDAGAVAVSETNAGSLVEVGVTAADGASVVVAERAVTSATATTVSSTGAGRTINADVGRLVVITAGTGAGQRREVVSNTAAQWVVAAWSTIPDTTSLMEVVAEAYESTETVGAVTAIPAESTQTGYLVKVASNGTPYIDFTAPLTASVDAGVSLPAVHALMGGTIRYSDGALPDPLVIVTPDRRFDVVAPAVYVAGETVYLCGIADDWSGVQSLELHYVPVAPALARLSDTLLLPDAAKPCVVAQAAAYMAARVAGMPEVAIDPMGFAARGEAAERQYLSSLILSKRATTMRIREDW